MSSNYPPGVTGNEPQIAGYPDTPENALGDVLSDIRHLYGFDYSFDADRLAVDIIKRLAEYGDGYVLLDRDTLTNAMPEHIEGHRVWKAPLAATIMHNLGVKRDG